MAMKKTTTLLTRVMFCSNCEKNKMPQKGNLFLTIGRGRQKYEIHKATKNASFGFTPHIIEKTKIDGGFVTFAASCAMNDCEAQIELNEETGKYAVALLNATIHVLPIREWNSLVNFTKDYSLD